MDSMFFGHVPHQIMLFLQFDIVATRHVDRSHSGSATAAFAVQRHSQQQPLDFTPLTGSYTGGSQICLAAAAGLLLLALLAHLAKGCKGCKGGKVKPEAEAPFAKFGFV